MFSCIEHKTPWKRETPRRKFQKKISPLDNSDFGKFWAGYLNSKIRSNYFLKYVISNPTRKVFGNNIDLPSVFRVSGLALIEGGGLSVLIAQSSE